MIQPTEERPTSFGGTQRIYTFENGYGASVVQHSGSYGGDAGLWELAVTHGGPAFNDSHLCYATPITSDVIGWLTEAEVDDILERILDLPYLNANGCPREKRDRE